MERVQFEGPHITSSNILDNYNITIKDQIIDI